MLQGVFLHWLRTPIRSLLHSIDKKAEKSHSKMKVENCEGLYNLPHIIFKYLFNITYCMLIIILTSAFLFLYTQPCVPFSLTGIRQPVFVQEFSLCPGIPPASPISFITFIFDSSEV